MSQQSVIPQNMHAIVIEGGVGPPRVLKLASIKTPTPKSGEVLIRVHTDCRSRRIIQSVGRGRQCFHPIEGR
jgi:hypothetical protein